MRYFRRLAICAAALLGLSAALAGRCEAGTARLTLMVYLCGSNLETEAGAATKDMEEMMAALPEDGSVQIVALAGGSSDWRSQVDPDAANIYRLTPDGIELAEAGAQANMGDGQTLARLLRYGWDACPAERYALLLWDHGAGPMMGVCFDERTDEGQGMDCLSLPELREALAQSPFAREKLSWIGFDACLMASVETACVVAPYAEYMIASQEAEPVDGWSYAFLTEAGRDASGAETGRRAVDAYAEYYADSLSDITLSCVDLSRIGAVAEEMTALFEGFSVDAENYADFARGRNEARSVGSGVAAAYDLVDLADLLEIYEEEGIARCEDLRRAVAEAVVCSAANVPFHNGLSLYYPFVNKPRYMSPWASLSDEIGFAEGYRAFIKQASAIWLGESLADWREPNHIAADGGERNMLTMQLSDEQLTQFAGARLLVLEEGEPGLYRVVYDTDDVALRGDTLAAHYSGEALFITDEEGLPRSGAVFYHEKAGDLYALATLYLPDETSPYGWWRYEVVWLRYRANGAGGYALAEIQQIGEDGLAGKSTLRLEDCDKIEFSSVLCEPVRDADGKLLPYSNWELSDYTVGDLIDDIRPDTVTFLPLFDEEPRWAMFEVTDLQGGVYASELFPLPNENRTDLQAPPQTLMDGEACAVTLQSAEASVGAYQSLDLTCEIVNRTDTTILFEFRNLRFDDTLVDSVPTDGVGYLEPGESQTRRLRIPMTALRDARVRKLDRLDFDINIRGSSDEAGYVALDSAHASLPLRLDTRILIPDPLDDAPLDSAAWGDVDIELLAVDQSPEVYSTALIRFVNRGEETIHMSWDRRRYALNGMPCTGTFDYSALDLPPGGGACLWVRLYGEDSRMLRERVKSIEMTVFAFDDDARDETQRRNEAVIHLDADET